MKIKLTHITLLLLFVINSFNCKKEDTDSTRINDTLVGKWCITSMNIVALLPYENCNSSIEFSPDGPKDGISTWLLTSIDSTNRIIYSYEILDSGSDIIFKEPISGGSYVQSSFKIRQLNAEKLVLHNFIDQDNFLKIEAEKL